MRIHMYAAACITISFSIPAFAQNVGGGVPIEVYDGTAKRCVNPAKDHLSLMVKHIKQQKEKRNVIASWFSEDKSFGLKIEATITAPTESGRASVSLMKAASVTAKQFSGFEVMQMIDEISIFSQMPLKNEKGNYTNLSYSMNFVNTRGASMLAKTTMALIEITAKAPLPPNPYTQGIEYAGQIINTLVTKSGEKDDGDTKPLINKTYEISTQCLTGQLRTGVVAQIFDMLPGGRDGNGFIRTQDSRKYCYAKDDGDENYALKFRKKLDAKDDCKTPDGDWQPLANPQVVYLVNAYDQTLNGGPLLTPRQETINQLSKVTTEEFFAFSKKISMPPGATTGANSIPIDNLFKGAKVQQIQADILNSLARCKVMGVSAQNCL